MFFKRKPSVPTVRPRGNTDKLPMELDISTSRASAVKKMLAGTFFAVIGPVVFNNFPVSAQIGSNIGLLFQGMSLFTVALGVVTFALGVIGYTHRRIARFENGQVTVSGKSLLRSENWSEPLQSYDGVLRRELVVNSRNSGTTRSVFQILDLQHPNPARSIPLDVTKMQGTSRQEWEHFAKLLGVPAIDAIGGEVRVRAAEDIDKSIKQLATENKIEAEWGDRPPPAGLQVAHEGDDTDPDSQTIIVTIRAKRSPLWYYGGLLVISTSLIAIGIYSLDIVLPLIGVTVGVAVIWQWIWEDRNPRTVRITRSQVVIDTPRSIGNPDIHSAIPHHSIESVDIIDGPSNQFTGKQIVIATDQGDHDTGSGLSKDGLAWLRDIIMSAVAKA